MARSLTKIAGLVGAATAVSKVMGMVRQLLIAAYFGSGAELSAYAVAYVLPGFLLILLGGINGPFHSAIISVLRKREGEDKGKLLESISTLVGLVLLAVTVVLMLAADSIVRWTAPGASATVHELAAVQLRIMAPLALLAGWIGIGFGALNAAESYTLPALSPLLSSTAVVGALALFGSRLGITVLAWGTLIGAVAQWAAQLPLQARLGLGRLRPRFDWGSPAVKTVGMLLLPAVISSGMVHINVYVDLFFASFIPGDRTIGNLGYAQLLIQTPLGLLSNMILVPLMPVFASLGIPERWPALRTQIQRSILTTVALSLPLSMLLCVLAEPMVRLLYERGKFTAVATEEVALLLIGYGVGMVFYLVRDVQVRIFYALEDGQTPLRISLTTIALNAGLDWLGVLTVGSVGIPLATAGVNAISVLWLAIALQRRLGTPLWSVIGSSLLKMLGVTVVAGLITMVVASPAVNAPWLTSLIWTLLAMIAGLGCYVWGGMWLGIPEFATIVASLRRKGVPTPPA